MHYDDVILHYGVKGMKWGVRKKISDFGHKLYDGHKENLLYKYRTNGYSEKDAQEKLRKRLRNEKIGAAALGLAAAGAAAYFGKNYLQDEFFGRTLKKGSIIDTVTSSEDLDKSSPFYGAFRDMDKMKYRGYLGRERMQKRIDITDAAIRKKMGLDSSDKVMKLVAKSDVKIAPNKVAKDSFEKLYKNDASFKNAADKIIRGYGWDIKGTNYEKFNVGLVDGRYNSESKNAIQKFYGALKDKGYHALNDLNDKKFSGYETANPTVFFDNANINKSSIKKLTNSVIDRDARRTDFVNLAKAVGTELGPKAAGLAGFVAVTNEVSAMSDRKADKEYQKKYGRNKK